jgi:hypothetical protein
MADLLMRPSLYWLTTIDHRDSNDTGYSQDLCGVLRGRVEGSRNRRDELPYPAMRCVIVQ